MSDIKLFQISGDPIRELPGSASNLERPLQRLIEENLETFLGIRFLATEYATGRTHSGRIDTLGIDENDCPVILEYKRTVGENVINQGLFYLDWLLDHKADFTLLVQKKLGMEAVKEIDWSTPRLICIAKDFTRYDEHAVQQIERNIELIRYRKFGDGLLMFELVNANAVEVVVEPREAPVQNAAVDRTITDTMSRTSQEFKDLFEAIKTYLLSLGDDAQMKTQMYYFAFKRIRNFACIEPFVHPEKLLVFLKIDPDTLTLEPGFTRDVRAIGHAGTGTLEVTIKSIEDFEKAKPLLQTSYEAS